MSGMGSPYPHRERREAGLGDRTLPTSILLRCFRQPAALPRSNKDKGKRGRSMCSTGGIQHEKQCTSENSNAALSTISFSLQTCERGPIFLNVKKQQNPRN